MDVGIPRMFSSSTIHRSHELTIMSSMTVVVMMMCVDRDDNA